MTLDNRLIVRCVCCQRVCVTAENALVEQDITIVCQECFDRDHIELIGLQDSAMDNCPLRAVTT